MLVQALGTLRSTVSLVNDPFEFLRVHNILVGCPILKGYLVHKLTLDIMY